MKQKEYGTGTEARKRFEGTMKMLFRVPKAIPKKGENPADKQPKKGQG